MFESYNPSDKGEEFQFFCVEQIFVDTPRRQHLRAHVAISKVFAPVSDECAPRCESLVSSLASQGWMWPSAREATPVTHFEEE